MRKRVFLLLCIAFLSISCDSISSFTSGLFGDDKKTVTKKKKKSPADSSPADSSPADSNKPGDSSPADSSKKDKNSEDKVSEDKSPSDVSPDAPLPDVPSPDSPPTTPLAVPATPPASDAPPADAPPPGVLPTNPSDPNAPSVEDPNTSAPAVVAPVAPVSPKAGPAHKIDVQIGGLPNALFSDDRFLYATFGNKLVIYDFQLMPKGVVQLKELATQIRGRAEGAKRFLYVIEEGNQIEIVMLPEGGKPSVLKAFGGSGALNFLRADLTQVVLSIGLGDKIQALDVTNPEVPEVLWEYRNQEVSQIFQHDETLFANASKNLLLLEPDTQTTRSVIPVGRDFSIVGFSTTGSSDQVWLALASGQAGFYDGLMGLTLSEDGKGVIDLGKAITLDPALSEPWMDQSQLFLKEVGQWQKIEMSTGQKQPVALSQFTLGPSMAFGVSGHHLLRLKSLPMGVLPATAVPMPSDNIAVPKGLAMPQISSALPPGTEKEILLVNDLKGLWLPGSSVLVWMGAEKGDVFYSATTLEDAQFTLSPVKSGKTNLVSHLWEASRFGLIFEDQNSHQLLGIKKDLSEMTTVKSTSKAHFGLDVFPLDEKSEYLLELTGEAGKLVLQGGPLSGGIYRQTSQLLMTMATGGVRAIGLDRAIVGCGASLCVVDLGKNRSKYAVMTQVPLSDQSVKVKDIQLSPNYKAAYLFVERGEERDILLVSLGENIVEMGRLANVMMDEDQFRGMSFSAGGARLLLPQERGLAIYNVSDLRKPKLVEVWEEGVALFADVTNKGQTLCAAFIDKGVLCTDL